MAEAREEVTALLETIVTPAGAGEPADLAARVRRLDQLGQQRGGELPPMLRHYLEKRSYAKALEFVAGQDRRAKPGCA